MPHFIKDSTTRKYGTYTDSNGTRSDQIFPSQNRDKTMRSGVNGHYGYPHFPPDRAVGGSFHLDSAVTQFGSCEIGVGKGYGPYANTRYEGGFYVHGANAWVPSTDLSELNALGAAAYRKMKPTKPVWSGLNALVELRDLPHMLKLRFHENDLKNIANWHVALQFGWLPLLNDVRSLVNLQRNGQERLKQLLRDNGRPVRRKIIMSDDLGVYEDYEGEDYSVVQPYLPYFFTRPPRRRVLLTQRIKTWASARFRYWLPEGPRDVKWRRSMLARLAGNQVTPSVVYNAIPWSWLIDWFSNTGDLISNLDVGVADRLAADYFYVMKDVETVRSTTATVWHLNMAGEETSASETTYATSSSKMRGEGDPFGWATSSNSLSAMQLSILGALGLSRLR